MRLSKMSRLQKVMIRHLRLQIKLLCIHKIPNGNNIVVLERDYEINNLVQKLEKMMNYYPID